MLGKISWEQEQIILKKLASLPKNNEYNVVHLGAGYPRFDPFLIGDDPHHHLKFCRWSREIHLAQCEKFPDGRDGYFRTLVRKINVKYSDLYSKIISDEIEKWSSVLRSEEDLSNPDGRTSQLTGKQEFCRLNVLDIDLPDESVDYLIAVGLFSKYVSIVWKNLPKALSESRRVLKKNGALILTLHSDYFEEFSETASRQSFDLEILDDSPDEVSEVDRGGNRMLLSCKRKRPPSD
tara:strand:- start:79 stop:786 length:708 start_codon:yes stop_codon:yes gene_type:complete